MNTRWNPIPQSLPPCDSTAPMQGRWSQRVWLALDDGRVVPGQCLHWDARRPVGASEPVHSWFIEPQRHGMRSVLYEGTPVAWALIEEPPHPWGHELNDPREHERKKT